MKNIGERGLFMTRNIWGREDAAIPAAMLLLPSFDVSNKVSWGSLRFLWDDCRLSYSF